MAKAVFFDLYETLITEWENGKKIADFGTPGVDSPASVLGISEEAFAHEWTTRRLRRMNGDFSDYYSVLKDICETLRLRVEEEQLQAINQKRIVAKQLPFRGIRSQVLEMLQSVKRRGLMLGLISNCSSEEIKDLDSSSLANCFDDIVLSFQVGCSKPDNEIYRLACNRLDVEPFECVFVGDGGANELVGATNVGMKAYRATWFYNKGGNAETDDFPQISDPLHLLHII